MLDQLHCLAFTKLKSKMLPRFFFCVFVLVCVKGMCIKTFKQVKICKHFRINDVCLPAHLSIMEKKCEIFKVTRNEKKCPVFDCSVRD